MTAAGSLRFMELVGDREGERLDLQLATLRPRGAPG